MRRHAVLALVLVFALAAVGSAAEKKRYNYYKRFFEPTEEIVTPHIAWAKPYARGPVRVLFITYRNAMREVVEIAQRLSMDYKVVAAESFKQLGLTSDDKWWKLAIKGTTQEEIADLLRERLKDDIDVIVLHGVKWDIIPLDCQYEILKKVKAGTGLVGYTRGGTKPYLDRALQRKDKAEQGTAAAEAVLSGVPFPALPAFASATDASGLFGKYVRCATFGEGRLLVFKGIRVPRFQGMVPGATGDVFDVKMLDYDYYLSLAIKSILWAAKKEAPVRVAAASPVLTVDRGAADKRHVTFQLQADEALGNVKLKFILRNSDNTVLHSEEKTAAIAAGQSSADLAFPAVPAGRCFADLWVMKGDKVAGWGSVGVFVTSPSQIAEIALARESFKTGEAISGAVSLEGIQDGMALRVAWSDNFGRLLAHADIPVKNGQAEAEFLLKGIHTLSILQILSIKLMKGEETLDAKRKFVPVSDFYPDREDVRFVMWQNLPKAEFISPRIAREFYRKGIDTQYTTFSKWAPLGNLWHLPYAIRFTDTKTDGYNPKRGRAKDDFVRAPCLTNPEYLATVKDRLTKRAKEDGPYSTNDFSLGDECHFVSGRHELCFSPTCIASFREYVKKEYGDLAKLNKEYGTSYKSWDEVMPGKLADAKKTGNYAPWVDQRLHMESVWAGIYDSSRKLIKDIVPTARVGYEGSDTRIDSYHASDHYKLMKSMDLNNIYFRRFIVDMVRDFGPPNTLFGGGWTGGYPSNMNEPYMRWFPWMTLFRGANSFWIWMGYGGAGGVMAFDLSLYPYFEAHCEEVREIKRGIGKLMILSKYENDGIAILQSPASVHVNTITEDMPRIDQAYGGLCCLLEDLGLQYRVVASEEVKKGILKDGRFKALFLCMAQALSDAEIAEIRSFAERGGTVIADVRPAVTNEHGTPREAGALDDLFGIRQVPAAAFRKSKVQIAGGGDITFSCELPECAVDDSLKVTSGKSYGKADATPTLILSTSGKGKATVLNFSYAAYYNNRKGWWFGRCKEEDMEIDYPGWEEGNPLRAVMHTLLGISNVEAPVTVEPEVAACQIGRFKQGDCELVGLLPGLPRISWAYTFKMATLPPAKPAGIRFAKTAHIYDVRTGRYLGHADHCKVDLRPGYAKLFALMPYRVAGVKLDAPARIERGHALPLKASVQADGKPGTHVFHLTFLDPSGRAVQHYARNVKAPAGQFTGTWTPALNDATGAWQIEARDVISGQVARIRVEIVK